MARTLPTELIELVFSSVDGTQRKTLANICLTNKLGYRAATPVLYRRQGFATPHSDQNTCTTRLLLQCRTLLFNRTLVNDVLEIEHARDDQPVLHAVPWSFLDPEKIRHIFNDELQVPSSIRRLFVEGTAVSRRFAEDNTLLLLTLLCPRLQSLRLNCGFHDWGCRTL